MSYGMKTDVGLSFQNSYGTSLVNSIYWLSFLSEDFAVSKEQIISEGMRGIFDEGAHYEGMNSVDATLEVEAHPISLGAMMRAAFGNPTSVQSGGIFAHTFKPRTADFDLSAAGIPCTIVKQLGDAGSAHHFSDMVASKFGLSIANGELLKASIGFLGGKYAQSAAVAASYPTGKHWTFDVASVTLATSAQGGVVDLNLEIDESLENRHTVGTQKTPSRTVRSGFRTLSIDGTLIFDNQNEYQRFLDQSERELIVNLKGTTEIQSGYFETLTIRAPLFRYAEIKPVAGGPGKIEASFSSKGVYSVSSATALQITLVNTQAAY